MDSPGSHTHAQTHTHTHSLTFDRVEHSYLWRMLEEFGLSSGFIAMIRVLYQDVESILKINGGLSAPFTVFYNHFATIFRTVMSFFTTLDTKLKTVITCNTGCLMFKTLHCAFTSLKKSCSCTIIGSKNKFTVKYH